jgi:hypothetical protein
MDSLHRKCKEASIDRSKTFYLPFYLLLILPSDSKQEIDAQLRSKTFYLTFGFASIYACLYP